MRPVSAAFQEAVRQPVREDRIEGYLGLWVSETLFRSYHFDEEHIVQGSLTITDQLPGGKFGFGGAYTRNLAIKLDLDKFGSNMNKTLVNLTDGEIMLFYYLTLEDGSEERVFLGQYFIDSEKSSRKFNVLSITALDGLSKLKTPVVFPPSSPLPKVYDFYTYACSGASDAPSTQEFIQGLPNGNDHIGFSDASQVQTNLDLLMWLGEYTGTFVRECRDDPPDWERSPLFNSPHGRPELVQIPTKYTQGGTSGNFNLTAFEEDNGSIIPADVRFSTDFSDTSIRITNWQMNCKGEMVTVKRSWDIAPDTLEGTMELDSNPIVVKYSHSTAQTIIEKIADYGEELRFCPFKTIFNGNPAIEVGDFVYLEPGGAIDETQYKHYGIVTYYKWRFRGKCELRCSTDAVASYTRPKVDESGASVMSARTVNTPVSVRSKSQLEKRMDGFKMYELLSANSSSKLSVEQSRIVLSNGLYIEYSGVLDRVTIRDFGTIDYQFLIDLRNARIGFYDPINMSYKWVSIKPT